MTRSNSSILNQLVKVAFKGDRHLPGQLIIQYSDACNATCPQCELRVTNRFKRATIPVEDMKRNIDAAAEKGVQALSFTGGEPLLFQDQLFELIRYAARAGIRFIRTGTNGFIFRHSDQPGWEARIRRFAENMASTQLYTFWISIDSAVPAVHETMRGLPGVIQGIEKALPLLHEHGIFPAANLGINRNTGGWWPCDGEPISDAAFYDHFRGAFSSFYRFVSSLGFTITNTCYPMSVESSDSEMLDSVYGASTADDIVRFSDREKALLFQALLDTIPEYRHAIRIFSPLSSIHALQRYYQSRTDSPDRATAATDHRSSQRWDDSEYGYPCRGGYDYFFIDAQTGRAYPCGFRGHDCYGNFWDMDHQQRDEQPFCRECDWECFRDPSDLLGPLLELRHAPLMLARRWLNDRKAFHFWLGDIRYQMACNFFSGRQAPDTRRLARFRKRTASAPFSLEALELPQLSRPLAQWFSPNDWPGQWPNQQPDQRLSGGRGQRINQQPGQWLNQQPIAHRFQPLTASASITPGHGGYAHEG